MFGICQFINISKVFDPNISVTASIDMIKSRFQLPSCNQVNISKVIVKNC